MWKNFPERLRRQLCSVRGVRLVVILGVAGLALILLSGFLPSKEETPKETTVSAIDSSAELQAYCNQLESRLVQILEQMDGVGKCEVMLTATGTAETVYAQDEETDRAEEKIQAQRKCVIVSDGDGEQALVERVVSPQISGVIIVCSGASSSVVQERVSDAVQAVLDIPSNRICVMPRV